MADNSRFTYFLAGIGIGTLIGVLFAPKAGGETRDFLSGKANEGADYLKRKSREVREQANDYVVRGKEIIDRGRQNLDAAIEAGKHAYREAAGMPPQEASSRPAGSES